MKVNRPNTCLPLNKAIAQAMEGLNSDHIINDT